MEKQSRLRKVNILFNYHFKNMHKFGTLQCV